MLHWLLAARAGGSRRRASCACSLQFQILLLADFARCCEHCWIQLCCACFLAQERALRALRRCHNVGITQPARNL